MGQFLETVTIQHERAAAPRQVRISARVRAAIDCMVHEGLKRKQAAQSAGITDDALRKALLKPEVLAYLNTQQGVLRNSARARSIARIDNLADDSDSDHVKLQSNVFLLGIEGIAPTQRIENTHIHQNAVPGLVINFITAPGQAELPRVIEGQAREIESVSIPKDLPVPVPHPSAGNAPR